jgi:hypothetical protein
LLAPHRALEPVTIWVQPALSAVCCKPAKLMVARIYLQPNPAPLLEDYLRVAARYLATPTPLDYLPVTRQLLSRQFAAPVAIASRVPGPGGDWLTRHS